MDLFTRESLRQLIESRFETNVSIYMPTHRGGREVREDGVRVRNLADRAEEDLKALGVKPAVARGLVGPIRELQTDSEFWRYQSDGLAMFSAPGFFKTYRLPVQFRELCLVNNRFHVKPLLPILQNDGRFYLLAASQNRVRFFEGSHYSVMELHSASLPRSLAEALDIDEYQQSMQHHSHSYPTAGMKGRQEGMFHGHGGSDMDIRKKDELQQYFHRVDAALKTFFGGERAPLVFAGVDYLFPLFRKTCSYKHLVDEPVAGNHDELPAEQLHQKAWKLIEPLFRRQADAALEEYGNRQAAGAASDDLEEVLFAARDGAVDTLFIDEKDDVWGTVDEAHRTVQRLEQSQPGSEDLLDDAAAHTMLNSGTVHSLPRERLPNGKPIAASFRYPLKGGESRRKTR
ncbi:MAG: hypothetical protein KY476_04170 [Planctomycetes bacterium]|nr:hypothetical protein [Planctomycetota bacterium]